MRKRKISIVLTEKEWKAIIYILGALSGATEYADAIENQIVEQTKL